MKRLFLQVVCLLMILLTLCACSASQEPSTEPKTYYTVVYMFNGNVYESQTVEEGQTPPLVEFDIPGFDYEGWMDESGTVVEAHRVPVFRNISYTAKVQPTMSRHMPYLELDEQGYLNPDEPLTCNALKFALQALCEETVYPFLPELPQAETVSVEGLKNALSVFFTEEQLAAVTAADETAITRAEFAAAITELLGWDTEEAFILAASAVMPEDITAQRTDAAILLEASMRHTHDPEGQTWNDLALPVGWEPGLHMEDGWLYYVQPDGKLLRDGQLDKLYFGADGRYTSGDPELDTLVADKLKTIMEENPELWGLGLLRKVYDHCHKDYKYLRKDAYDFGATGWEVEDAKEMLQSGRGNCYNFAAIFWALAQGMGYDVQCLAGTCTGTDQPHGWVVLKYEGVSYFVDPEWQYAYTEREVFDKDMFMLTMDEVWWWTYRWDNTQFSA